MDSQGRVIQEVQGQQNLANKETITENDNVITLIHLIFHPVPL
jgi:hypothetical protein